MRNDFHVLGITAIWLIMSNVGFAQSDPGITNESTPGFSSSSLSQTAEPPGQPVPTEIAVDCLPCKPTTPINDGITVSMLNGKSRLKIFGSLSALSVFSTDRPFAPGMPLFLLPESSFGLNTNTFDIHGRQSNIGATFIGPEANGFTPSATFV